MDWHNFGDVNFGEWGGWLIAKDPEMKDAYYGLFLATPDRFASQFDKGGGDCYALEDAWVDLDRWEEGCADPKSKLAELASMYDSPEMALGIEHARSVLGDEEVAFLLLDSGLEDANREWLGSDSEVIAFVSADTVREHMEDLGAGGFAPKEVA